MTAWLCMQLELVMSQLPAWLVFLSDCWQGLRQWADLGMLHSELQFAVCVVSWPLPMAGTGLTSTHLTNSTSDTTARSPAAAAIARSRLCVRLLIHIVIGACTTP